MKLHFENPYTDDRLNFQKDAIEAVCDLFRGQEPVNARVVNGKNQAQWEVLLPPGSGVQRLPYRPREEKELRRYGYQEVNRRGPARAMILFGSSGATWPRIEAVLDELGVVPEPRG